MHYKMLLYENEIFKKTRKHKKMLLIYFEDVIIFILSIKAQKMELS